MAVFGVYLKGRFRTEELDNVQKKKVLRKALLGTKGRLILCEGMFSGLLFSLERTNLDEYVSALCSPPLVLQIEEQLLFMCSTIPFTRLKIDEVDGLCYFCKQRTIEQSSDRVCSVCLKAVLLCDSCRQQYRGIYFCNEHESIFRGIYYPFLDSFSKSELLEQRRSLEKVIRSKRKKNKFKEIRSICWKQIDRINRLLKSGILSKSYGNGSRCRRCGNMGPMGAISGRDDSNSEVFCSGYCFPSESLMNAKHGLKRKRSTSGDMTIEVHRTKMINPNQYVYNKVHSDDRKQVLRTVLPYIHRFESYAKQRWVGKRILDVFNEEFGANTPQYHLAAIKLGLITVNFKVIDPSYELKDGDQIEHVAHIHEPPVLYSSVSDMLVSESKEIVAINKPASMPVHPCGAYRANSLTSVLSDASAKFTSLKPLHRIDRLVSGLVLFSSSSRTAREVGRILTRENDHCNKSCVKKTYLAQVHGRFPGSFHECSSTLPNVHEDGTSNLPLLSSLESGMYWLNEGYGSLLVSYPLRCADKKLGIWEVGKSGGKQSVSRFQLLKYKSHTNTSIIRAEPLTGRTHQLRIHLQHIGFPIVNDPNYGQEGNISQVRLRKDRSNRQAAFDCCNLKENCNLEERAKAICRYCNEGPDSAFSKLQLRWNGICLHALSYEFIFASGEHLKFETPFPDWAQL